MSDNNLVQWLRHAAPYIHTHRGKTFVLLLSGEAVLCPNFSSLIQDMALLSSLGVRLVLVHGARPQINQLLEQQQIESQFHQQVRVTDESTLTVVKQAVGSVRTEIEAQLSAGLANSPMQGAAITVCSGNFIAAKPRGIEQGVDFQYTGSVRRIDTGTIENQLDAGNLVLLSCLGYSVTGEAFNLCAAEVAQATATALEADKLIGFVEEAGIVQKGKLCRELSPEQALTISEQLADDASKLTLKAVGQACDSGNIQRGHLVSFKEDGALLAELFSRDGSGTLIDQHSYENIRPANLQDVGGILTIIQPLEAEGLLVRRPRERLEQEINFFCVIERDGLIIGCAALYSLNETAEELACLAIHPEYNKNGRGKSLLQYLEQQATAQGVEQLFSLTTHASHWFQEQGFTEASIDDLPAEKKSLYNYQRNSKVFLKTLN